MNPSERITVHHGDNREVLKGFPDNHFDSVVTDPPYALVSIVKRFGKAGSAPAKGNDAYMRASNGFMGQAWDNGETAFDPEFWAEVLRVLKPGGHIAAFSGTRTYHRMACAIEDAGFEIRDQLAWTYGSGFPKSHDVSKGIDRKNGDTRPVIGTKQAGLGSGKTFAFVDGNDSAPKEIAVTSAASAASAAWEGFGTALKPAWEPICLGRKPLEGTVATNVLKYGTGALNIVGTRVGTRTASTGEVIGENVAMSGPNYGRVETDEITIGRWPANILHDGSEEVVALFPDVDTARSVVTSKPGAVSVNGAGLPSHTGEYGADESGSAARFFYTAKADSDDRLGSKHPTVKPLDLMQWLVRLITPPGGLVLEPFAGSGTTGEAAFREGMRCTMIEREESFVADIRRRIGLLLAGPDERSNAAMKAKIADGRIKEDHGPLFGGQSEAAGGRQIYGHFADQDERLARRDSSGEGWAMTKRDDMVTKLLAGWVSVPDLLAATGWLPHTLRAAICVAAKKHGYKVERQRIDGITSYRFAAKIVAEVAAE